MIFISLVACIGSSIILVIFGAPSTDENSKYYGVYIGTCMYTHISEFVFENVCIGSCTFLKILLNIRIYFCIRLVGIFCLMAIWILLLLDCSKRRYYRSTSTFISHRLWYWWVYFPTCDGCCLQVYSLFYYFNLSDFCGMIFHSSLP